MKLRPAIEAYIDLKQAMGFRFRVQGYVLRAFHKGLGSVSLGQVTPQSVNAFVVGSAPGTAAAPMRWSTLSCFYRFVVSRGWARKSPVPARPPKVTQPFTPYIYSRSELQRLLRAITADRTRGLSPETMRALVLLLYGAGLRISEALNLQNADVDLGEGVLCVRHSKFFKTRLVPIGPKLVRLLADYARDRPSARHGTQQRFFLTKRGGALDYSLVSKIFRTLRQAAQVQRTDASRYQPRLHDLRHSMATHCLLAWYREGADVTSRLIQLSTYLGHSELASTQVYLTLTSELREHASSRFARYAWVGGDHE